MRIGLVLVVLLGLDFGYLGAQNLIPNGDFEKTTPCPKVHVEFDRLTDWYNPTGGTPDVYNACTVNKKNNGYDNVAGFQIPHSYFGYAGILMPGLYFNTGSKKINFTSIREYMQNKIVDTDIGAVYEFKCYVSLANKCFSKGDKFGMVLSENSLSEVGFNKINAVPTVEFDQVISDTTNWVELTDTFTSEETYSYITLGCFRDSAEMNMIYFTDNPIGDERRLKNRKGYIFVCKLPR